MLDVGLRLLDDAAVVLIDWGYAIVPALPATSSPPHARRGDDDRLVDLSWVFPSWSTPGPRCATSWTVAGDR